MITSEIKRGESESLEFKRELPSKDKKVMKTVVAFANGKGGRIIFGVENESLKIVGIEDTARARLQDALTDMISETCYPQIIPSFSWYNVDGKSVLVLAVPSSPQCPYYIKSEGVTKGVYVRVGATTRVAGPEKVHELQLKGQNRSYDEVVEHTVPYATEAAISTLCKEISAYNGEPDKPVSLSQLLSWNLLKKTESGYLPSNAFRLLTGDSIHFSGIQCAVFQGADKVDFLDRKEFFGPVYEQLENAQRFLMQYLRSAAEIKGLRRKDIYEIPLIALRETLANAIIHRNYLIPAYIQVSIFDDRVEIVSPGALYDNMLPEEMMSGVSRLRNKLLADVFYRMKIVEKWGTGISRVRRACEQAGLPQPVYSFVGETLKVIFSRISYVKGKVKKPRQRRPQKRDVDMLQFIKSHPDASLSQIATEFGVSVSTAWRFVQDMRKDGRLW